MFKCFAISAAVFVFFTALPAFSIPSTSDGQMITVHGTYEAVKHVSGYTFYNEIDADDASL